MNDEAQLYYAAQACLLELDHRGVASEKLLEMLRERMDGLWLRMSDEERSHSRQLAEDLLKKFEAGP